MGLLDRFKKDTTKADTVQSAPVKLAETKVATDTKTAMTPKKAVANVVQLPQSAKIQANRILLAPVVTEKATIQGTYYFRVASTATRNEVKKAIKTLYGKTARKVNMMSVKGKNVRFGQTFGKRADWKKAIVYLANGETIDLFAK